jgi:hypothetical protein
VSAPTGSAVSPVRLVAGGRCTDSTEFTAPSLALFGES